MEFYQLCEPILLDAIPAYQRCYCPNHYTMDLKMAYRNLTDIHEKYMSFWMSLTTTCPGLHGYMKVLMAKMVTYKYKSYSLVSQYEAHIYIILNVVFHGFIPYARV